MPESASIKPIYLVLLVLATLLMLACVPSGAQITPDRMYLTLQGENVKCDSVQECNQFISDNFDEEGQQEMAQQFTISCENICVADKVNP